MPGTVILDHSSLAWVARARGGIGGRETKCFCPFGQTLRMGPTLLYSELLRNPLKTCKGMAKGRWWCTVVKSKSLESGLLGLEFLVVLPLRDLKHVI